MIATKLIVASAAVTLKLAVAVAPPWSRPLKKDPSLECSTQ